MSTLDVVLATLVLLTAAAAAAAWGLSRGRAGRGDDEQSTALEAARTALESARTASREARERARAETERMLAAADDELGARASALEATERRLTWLFEQFQEARASVDERREAMEARQAGLESARDELEASRRQARERLLAAAGLDQAAAAATLLGRVEAELAGEHPGRVARAVGERLGEPAATADGLLADAIQRQNVSHADTAPRAAALNVEGLPEQARERLLGALGVVAEETFTELGVDDERQQITLRGLDPIGREVARQASLEVLERRLDATEVGGLLLRTRAGLREAITDLGERVLWEVQVEARPEIAELLGTLHYRFSYGQNALLHCRETGDLCAVLAAELGLDPHEGRRAGLFHDIGKAVDHDVEGSHAMIGGDMLAQLGVDPAIVHAVKAHHFDEEPSTDLAMLTICADAISASRPGARRDTVTTYVQRLEQLQQIATRHRGVERAFPMQAGREVRISVRPDQVADDQVPLLCNEIAREIEAEMTYPGMIKVTVIREIAAGATAS